MHKAIPLVRVCGCGWMGETRAVVVVLVQILLLLLLFLLPVPDEGTFLPLFLRHASMSTPNSISELHIVQYSILTDRDGQLN